MVLYPEKQAVLQGNQHFPHQLGLAPIEEPSDFGNEVDDAAFLGIPRVG